MLSMHLTISNTFAVPSAKRSAGVGFLFALVVSAVSVGLASSAWAVPPEESLVISFGVEGGQPMVETVGGLSVEPRDGVNLDDTARIDLGLPAIEDIDAFHFLPTNQYFFSTTTSVSLGGEIYTPGDIVLFDGATYSVFFDESLITAAARNIDALTILPNGHLLISTSLSSEIYGFAFQNGDVVEIDPVAETASLFMGLDEATLFSGANQDIDGLHYDPATGTLLISVRTAGGGTIGGLAYGDAASHVFEIDPSGVAATSVYLDGTGLFDGATRQLDSVFVPEPGARSMLILGTLGLVGLSAGMARSRTRRGGGGPDRRRTRLSTGTCAVPARQA